MTFNVCNDGSKYSYFISYRGPCHNRSDGHCTFIGKYLCNWGLSLIVVKFEKTNSVSGAPAPMWYVCSTGFAWRPKQSSWWGEMAPPQKAKVHGFFRQEESINTIYQIIRAAAKGAARSCTRGNFSNIKNLSPASELAKRRSILVSSYLGLNLGLYDDIIPYRM